jgi:hypothetical protein
MNWEAFGAIGEVIGATAVVVSLIYVSLQVRAGLRGLQTTTRDSVFKSLVDWNLTVMGDPRLAWIFQSGSKDFDSLTGEERARYTHIMYGFYKVFENIYLHHVEGIVPPEIWEPNKKMLTVYATQPGGRMYWEARRGAYDPRFIEVLERLSPGPLPAGHVLSKLEDDSDS